MVGRSDVYETLSKETSTGMEQNRSALDGHNALAGRIEITV